MKYEKFEEWMIGKKFYNKFDPDDIGVIIGESEPKGVLEVVYEIDGPSRASLRNIIFVDSTEEKHSDDKAPTKEGSQIGWEVGQEVFCLLRGKGFVESVDDNEGSPYTVGVDFGYTFDKYTIDGKIYDDHKGRVLFFSEPVITAELFPPKKSFKSVLKVGGLIAIKDKHCSDAVMVSFLKEDEERIYYAYNDGEKDYSHKENVSVYPFGEEIKFR